MNLNKDIAQHLPSPTSETGEPETSGKKKTVVIKHREAIGGGGFFETQVEVIEKEEVIEVDDNGTDDEGKEKKKDDRIFGFNNFNDFKQKYFTGREVDPLNNLSRISNIK